MLPAALNPCPVGQEGAMPSEIWKSTSVVVRTEQWRNAGLTLVLGAVVISLRKCTTLFFFFLFDFCAAGHLVTGADTATSVMMLLSGGVFVHEV